MVHPYPTGSAKLPAGALRILTLSVHAPAVAQVPKVFRLT
jgi:hypothetical protein